MKALRISLGAFFLLVIVEGAIRKWVFPGQQQVVYLLKDFLLLLSVGGLAIYGYPFRLEVRGRAVGLLLVVYGVYVTCEAFNPALPAPVLGIWGLRSHLLYASLIWLIPAAFRSSGEIAAWLRCLPLVAVPVCLLGVAQFLSPLNSTLNRYAAETDEIASFGQLGAARITGTFPYVSGMTTFVFVILVVCITDLLAGRRDRRWTAWLGLALGAVVIPMTGARWLVFVWIIVLPLLVGEMIWMFPAAGARFSRLTLGLAVLMVAVSTVSERAIIAFSERTRDAHDERQRFELLLADPLRLVDQVGLFGFGVGSSHQAAPVLLPDRVPYEWLPTTEFEGEAGRLMLELGLLGVVIAFSLKIAWIMAAHFALRNASSHAQFVIALIAMGFFAAHLITSVVFNVTAAAFYWGFAGALAVVIREQAFTLRGSAASAPTVHGAPAFLR